MMDKGDTDGCSEKTNKGFQPVSLSVDDLIFRLILFVGPAGRVLERKSRKLFVRMREGIRKEIVGHTHTHLFLHVQSNRSHFLTMKMLP